MPDIDINDIATIGSVRDQPSYMLPPEAWTLALNMRAVDGGLESLPGWTEVFAPNPYGNDSFTKVLLHFDNATTDTAFGGGVHTWTLAGNAAFDAVNKVFGSHALTLDGAGDWVTTADSADFTLGSLDWTVEGRVRPTTSGADLYICGQGNATATAATSSIFVWRDAANHLNVKISNGSTFTVVTGAISMPINTYVHVRVVRSGTNIFLFVNGVLDVTGTFSGAVNDSANAFRVGAAGEFTSNSWAGQIDEFRLDVGVARSVAAFSLPVAAYASLAEFGPNIVVSLSTGSAQFWLSSGLQKAFAFDGTTYANVTRQSAGVDVNYTATDTPQFNSTLLGGIAIINNGSDVPQYWPTISLATKLANLPNWPAANRCKIMRAFGPFLMAFGLTDAGVSKPHLVRWSHPADPGSVPVSWDPADQTRDTGETDLSDVQSGIIQDALPLGDTMFIYKESSIWKCRYIGGRSVFDFGKGAWLTNIGVLTSRCVAVSGDGLRHVVMTQDDIIWHNGNQVRSILNRRQRRRLFNEIDTVNFTQAFLFADPSNSVMYACYPRAGQTKSDVALLLNYRESEDWVVTEMDGVTFQNAAIGNIENPSEETWDGTEDLWDEDTGPWSELARRRVIVCDPIRGKFYNLNFGSSRDGAIFNSILQREGLSILGRKRNGEWIVDHQVVKLFRNLRPKIQGGPVNVRVGSAMEVNGATAWSSPIVYVTSTPNVNEMPVSGRAIGVEFSALSTASWRIDGYKADIEPLGEF